MWLCQVVNIIGFLVGLLVAGVIFIPFVRKTAEVTQPLLLYTTGALFRFNAWLTNKSPFLKKVNDLISEVIWFLSVPTRWLDEKLIRFQNKIQKFKKQKTRAEEMVESKRSTGRLESSLNVRDYLKTAEEAAKRSRTIVIVLLVASVLTFMGFLNSMKANWMLHRIWVLNEVGTLTETELEGLPLKQADRDRILNDIKYRDARIGPPPKPPDNNKDSVKNNAESGTKEDKAKKEDEFYRRRFDHFYTALMNSYIENSYTIRVPFFGVTFDINDLGVLGGAGLLIILFWYLIALMREIDNLKWSFKMAIAKLGHSGEGTQEFYHLLAMAQVLTVPRMHGSKRLVVSHTPKVFVILPVAVHWMLTKYDCSSLDIGIQIDRAHTLLNVKIEVALLLAILLLTVGCLLKGREINRFWTRMWMDICEAPSRRSKGDESRHSMGKS